MGNIRKKFLKFILVMSVILIFFSGCANLPSPGISKTNADEDASGIEDQAGTSEEEQAVQQIYRFTDIPVPENFKIDRKKSFIYEAGSIKAGIITYSGWSNLEKLVDFYKNEMLKYDWEILSIFEHTGVTLIYIKEGWNCTVRLSSKNLGGSTIEIQIGPISASK